MKIEEVLGPWYATTRKGSWDWVVASEVNPNIEICQMFHDGTNENKTGEARAYLVASGPDLYESLEMLIEAVRPGDQQKVDGAVLCGGRVLTRARGECK